MFLIVFAFFVFLNSLSSFEETKVEAAKQSLAEAFKVENSSLILINNSYLINGSIHKDTIPEIINATYPDAKIQMTGNGRVANITIKQSSLFLPENPKVSPGSQEFIEHLSARLNTTPLNHKFELEIIIQTREDIENLEDSLSAARASELMSAFINAGFSEKSIISGIILGKPNLCTIIIRLVKI